MFRGILTFGFIVLLIGVAESKTIYIPQDYPTIQQGIDASIYGNTVLVDPGTYLENINFKGKAITVASSGGADFTVIDGNHIGTVVTFANLEGPNSILDGFTITNGNADEGGGIYCMLSSPNILNNIITNNYAINRGGGIYCYNCAPNINNNIIHQNTCDNRGGGIYCTNSSSSIITDNIIHENSSYQGGGIYCNLSYPIISNNIINDNSVINSGGGIGCWGSSPIIISNKIYSNLGGQSGGGIYLNDNSSPSISNNSIIANSSDNGGGIYCYQCSFEITNNIISWNIANGTYGKGGGILCANSSINILNCTISENTAIQQSGGIYCNSNYASDSVTVKNTIFWNNNAPKGKEISLYSTLNIKYSDIDGGLISIHVDPNANLNWGPGMINDNPLFVDSFNNDFHLTWISPCINRGTNEGVTTVDIDGDTRPYMGTSDMGVDEFIGGHSLEAVVFSIPEKAGGVVNLTLNGGQSNGNRNYYTLGSISGNAPGQYLPGGYIIPLKWDIFTNFVIDNINSIIFINFMGTLDATGSGNATFDTLGPLPFGMAGITFSFAYAMNNPWDFVSNPINVEVVP